MQFLGSNYKTGRIFSGPPVGSMLDLYISPKNSIFIDSRFDEYSDQVLTDWSTLSNGLPGWDKLLDQYKVQWVITVPGEQLGDLLTGRPEWSVVLGQSKSEWQANSDCLQTHQPGKVRKQNRQIRLVPPRSALTGTESPTGSTMTTFAAIRTRPMDVTPPPVLTLPPV